MTSTKTIEFGNQVWRNQDGKYHRTDGPAVIYASGIQVWYVNGKKHRNDGPAYIGYDGIQAWWVNGKNITVQVNRWLEQNNKSYPFDKNTQILFKLTFGV